MIYNRFPQWLHSVQLSLLVMIAVVTLGACNASTIVTPAMQDGQAEELTLEEGEELATEQTLEEPSETDVDSTVMPEYEIALSDDGFDAPEAISAGVVKIHYTNSSTMQEGAPVLARLNEGTSLDALEAELVSEEPESFERVLKMLTFLGGGENTIYDLTPGQHIVIFAGNIEGNPPYASINVVDENNMAVMPTADVTVKLADFAFIMPDVLKAGKQTWQFTNEGKQVHHMLMVQLPDGVTVEDIIDWVSAEASGPPPFIVPDTMPVGTAFENLSPGTTAWAEIDLPVGSYTVFCLLPDMAMTPPHAHITHGMHRQVSVIEQ